LSSNIEKGAGVSVFLRVIPFLLLVGVVALTIIAGRPRQPDLSKLVPPDLPEFKAYQLCNQANNEFKSGNFGVAKSDLEQATKLAPDNAKFHADLGAVLEKMSKVPEAKAELQKAIQLNPTAVPPHSGLVIVDLDAGDYKAAKEDAKAAVKLGPNDSVAHNSLGLADFYLGQYKDALLAFQKGVSLDPKDMTCRLHLGSAQYALGNKAAANEAWTYVKVHGDEKLRARAKKCLKDPESIWAKKAKTKE
jgi:Flp pilus assembly protein TadD